LENKISNVPDSSTIVSETELKKDTWSCIKAETYANAKREGRDSMEYETTKAKVFWNLSVYYSEKFRRGHSMSEW